MFKQNLSALIAISMVLTTPLPSFAAGAGSPPECVKKDALIEEAWNKANGTTKRAKDIRDLIVKYCGKNDSQNAQFIQALNKYLGKETEAGFNCHDPSNPNCPKNKVRNGPAPQAAIREVAETIGKETPAARTADAPGTAAPDVPAKLSDGPVNTLPTRQVVEAPVIVPAAPPPPRFTAVSDTGLSQNLMWGLGGALLGGVVGYMMGSNNNNGYYGGGGMPYPPPWMMRQPFGMGNGAPPFLPAMNQQAPWMVRPGMMPGGMPGAFNGAPGAIPLFANGMTPGYGAGYGGMQGLGGYGGLGGIGGIPNYYMPGVGQISTQPAPAILPYPGPALSQQLYRPLMLGQ